MSRNFWNIVLVKNATSVILNGIGEPRAVSKKDIWRLIIYTVIKRDELLNHRIIECKCKGKQYEGFNQLN